MSQKGSKDGLSVLITVTYFLAYSADTFHDSGSHMSFSKIKALHVNMTLVFILQ